MVVCNLDGHYVPTGEDISVSMRVSEFFDEMYSTHSRYWWSDSNRYVTDPDAYPHSPLTQMTLRQLASQQSGRVLDVGAGEGADSIRLASLGLHVDAIDISEVAAAKIRKFAAAAGVEVSAWVADVTNFTPAQLYDVVLSKGVLHYVADKLAAVRVMQDSTAPGGINVISLWSTFSEVPEPHNRVEVYCDDEDGEVSKLYRDWKKEFYYFDRDKKERAHSDMPPHRHSHIKMIVRKPRA